MAIDSIEGISAPLNGHANGNIASENAVNGAASEKFTSIPILSLEKARNPDTKEAFLAELRQALLYVGFCYISDTGLPPELIQRVKDETFKFFDEDILPLAEKEKIEMKNEKSFLGWSRVSALSIIFLFLMSVTITINPLLVTCSQYQTAGGVSCNKRWTNSSPTNYEFELSQMDIKYHTPHISSYSIMEHTRTRNKKLLAVSPFFPLCPSFPP